MKTYKSRETIEQATKRTGWLSGNIGEMTKAEGKISERESREKEGERERREVR